MVYPAEWFKPEATLRACAQERCTSLYGVPTMFIAQLGHENIGQYDLSSLRTGIMAGSPCPIEVMKRVARLSGDARLLERFRADRGGDRRVPLDAHRRLATMDDDGYVRVVGRIKDMVIRGGENVYPREIEEFLHTHPQIADVQVIGVPDERYGEALMAWVVLRPGADVGEDELREFCRGQIAHYKIPRYFKFVDSYPMTVTGKVQKFKMRETAVQELGLDWASTIATA